MKLNKPYSYYENIQFELTKSTEINIKIASSKDFMASWDEVWEKCLNTKTGAYRDLYCELANSYNLWKIFCI